MQGLRFMVFRITNYCESNCLHCMENSTTKGEHATTDIIDKMIAFAKCSLKNKTIQISGGEPTSHPHFKDIVNKIIGSFPSTIEIFILSNGEFLYRDKNISNFITDILHKYPNTRLQITSIKGIYPSESFDKVKKSFSDWYWISTNRSISKQAYFEDTLHNGIIPVGRAIHNKSKINEVSYIAERNATSCFNLYNALQHFNGHLFDTIDYVKEYSKTSLCKPLITEKGKVKFGEYQSCSDVIDLSTIDLMKINRDIYLDFTSIDGACGSCISNTNQKDTLLRHLKYNKMLYKIPKKLKRIE